MDAPSGASIEGVAAFAVSLCEMGEATDEQVRETIADLLASLGIATREHALAVAQAIAALPQPEDQPAEERERRRHVEAMLGVTPPEQELAAMLRARDLVQQVADSL
jgi:sulfur carrier protein ThiS